jgi:predicted PurR-regulated permease PerM
LGRAAGLAVVIALLTGSPVQAVWAAPGLFVVQQVESHVLAPLVLGRAVRLPPLVVLVVVLIGAAVAGLLAMLIAVPVTACARFVLQHRRTLPRGLASAPSWRHRRRELPTRWKAR